MNIEKVHAHIESSREEDLELLKKLVRIPSIAVRNQGIDECCEVLTELLESFGVKVEVFPTNGAPVIFGERKCDNPDAKTLMFYGHYDVQIPDPIEEWDSPPFEPTVRDGRLYGRGVADNKGQFLAHILALRSYLKTNTEMPLNLKFFLEGEEEDSSRHILDFIIPHKDLLDCDLVYNADGGMLPDGQPYIQYGVRGLYEIELDLETAKVDTHSGHRGGVIPNAAWGMVQFLSTMIDEDGRCAIEGFYDDVLEPTEYDMQLIENLDLDAEAIAKFAGVKELKVSKNDFYLNTTLRPTFNINGLGSGYVGEGSRTVVPGHATAKMDFRLADAQDPDDIHKKFMKHVEKYCPEMKVTHISSIPPSRTKTDLPVCKAVVRAIEGWFDRKATIVPCTGATNSDYVFTKIAGLPSVCVPYANIDELNHSPNENMVIDFFHNGIHATAEVIKEISMLD